MTTTTKPRCLTSPAWEVRAILSGASAIARPIPLAYELNKNYRRRRIVHRPKGVKTVGGKIGYWEYQGVLNDALDTPADKHDFRRDVESFVLTCPPGPVGTRLAFRETWHWDEVGADVSYRADYTPSEIGDAFAGERWRSPATMPLWAVRLFATTTSVRVVRLGKLTEQQCIQLGSQLPVSQLPKKCAMGALLETTVFSRLWNFSYGKKHPWHPDRPVWLAEIVRANR